MLPNKNSEVSGLNSGHFFFSKHYGIDIPPLAFICNMYCNLFCKVWVNLHISYRFFFMPSRGSPPKKRPKCISFRDMSQNTNFPVAPSTFFLPFLQYRLFPAPRPSGAAHAVPWTGAFPSFLIHPPIHPARAHALRATNKERGEKNPKAFAFL